MKAYFVGSIRGKNQFLDNYNKIISLLKKRGFGVSEDTIRPSEKEVYTLTDDEKVHFYKQVLKWINEADVVVAECSFPSIGVGYEVSTALEKGKPVIALYVDEHAPHFLEGIESEKLTITRYDQNDIDVVLNGALDYALDQQDTRFNFFISPAIGEYLDWVSKKKRIPRAVYLRRLIEEDMKKNTDYEG